MDERSWQSRQRELELLTGEWFRSRVRELGIELAGYGALAR
jgi:hypothetical protein